MNSREKIHRIFTRKSAGEHAFWTGNPSDEIIPKLAEAWNIEPSKEAVYTYLNDDCRWIPAYGEYAESEQQNLLDPTWGGIKRTTLSAGGCFADAETVAEIEKYPWPDGNKLDFSDTYKEISRFQDKAVFTGMWSCFFHNIADFFGMENYFIKMYENPAVVDAVTEHVVDFYVAGNERFFQGLGDKADYMFFGNDFGTQRDLILSPEMFRRFILPSIKRLVAVGKKYNKTIMLHSCGSIYRIIPDLIDAGVEVLHPIQAKAAGMDAQSLSQYKNDLSFLGGLDAQSFFVDATPEQIKEEVRRVRSILSPNIVISPSHEHILPNVPPENVLAMAQAALES